MNEHRVDARAGAARYVRPVVSEGRIDRLWDATRGRLQRPRSTKRWKWGGAMVGAVALALAVVVVARAHHERREAASVWEGAILETGADALSMALVDGSSLQLGSSSRVEVEKGDPSAVRLVLRRGRVQCDVTHRPGRTFVVAAGGVEVHVVGTRFSVSMDPDPGEGSSRVEVHVDRGAVDVTSAEHRGEVTKVHAGESWSRIVHPVAIPRPIASAASGEPPSKTAAPPEAAEAAAAMAAPPGGAALPAAPAASAPIETQGPTSMTRGGAGGAGASRETHAGPRELLESANELRRAGHVREAAQVYESLLTRYPADARAGLGAFELGRLRMDRLSDMAGAVPALERAVELAPDASFREDAMARLVTAYARTDNMAGCKRARDRYLESYPSGIHRQSVAVACRAR